MPSEKLENLMTRSVATARPDMSLAEAAKLMWDADCGFLPVVDPATDALCGVVTGRDACMAGMSRGRPLQELVVAEAMSRAVHALHPEDTSSQAGDLMARNQVRRVPVVDAARHVLGVVSLNDLALNARDRDDERAVTRTLSAIGRHRDLPVAAAPERSGPSSPRQPVPDGRKARTKAQGGAKLAGSEPAG